MNRKLIVWIVMGVVAVGALYALLRPAPSVKKVVTGQELTQLQADGAWVIDVRTNSEYIAGHLPNSLNIPLDQLANAAATWGKDQPIVLYCATGGRSAEAADLLAAQGFRKVYDLGGGIAAWKGETVGGQSAAAPTGPNKVETDGKPVFIDFAGSS